MKTKSPFTHAMDGLRPQPARRAVVLQRILATRQPPLSLHHWRWALAGVPAVVALVLGLAWSLGAYDANRAAAPAKVTQAAVETAPEVQAANPGNGKVQWINDMAWSMFLFEDHHSTHFELENISPAELPPEVIQTVTNNLESKGWFSVNFAKISDGYFQLNASNNSNNGEAASHSLISDSYLLECMDNQRLQACTVPLGYPGLNLRLMDEGGSGISAKDSTDVNGKSLQTTSKFSVRKVISLNTIIGRLSLKEALSNAFYFQDGNPPFGRVVQTQDDNGTNGTVHVLDVNQVDLISVGGVPFYQIPLRGQGGTCNAYALAVAEKDLQTLPELYQNYQDFISGKSMAMEMLEDTFLWCDMPVHETFGMEYPIDFKLTLKDGVGENLPQSGALLYTNSGTMSDEGLQRMVESLQEKGWETISPADLSEEGLLLRSTSNGKAVQNAEQHRKLADQYIVDSGLVQLLEEHGYILSTLPSLVAQGETQYDLTPKTGQTIAPGFVRLRLGSDKSVIECRIQMQHIELLKLITLRPLSQCTSDVFAFSLAELNEADNPAVQKGMDIADARLIYVRGIPFYKMTVELPETKKSFTGYALAITMDELKAFPQALEQYKLFMQDGDETKDSQALVSVVDEKTGELLVSVGLPK